ncbi:MAG: hypothetical protein QF535_18420, partial [Anaerolineales bacterium]|nr:hypothetical protein [Anaerolineales bacterium]
MISYQPIPGPAINKPQQVDDIRSTNNRPQTATTNTTGAGTMNMTTTTNTTTNTTTGTVTFRTGTTTTNRAMDTTTNTTTGTVTCRTGTNTTTGTVTCRTGTTTTNRAMDTTTNTTTGTVTCRTGTTTTNMTTTTNTAMDTMMTATTMNMMTTATTTNMTTATMNETNTTTLTCHTSTTIINTMKGPTMRTGGTMRSSSSSRRRMELKIGARVMVKHKARTAKGVRHGLQGKTATVIGLKGDMVTIVPGKTLEAANSSRPVCIRASNLQQIGDMNSVVAVSRDIMNMALAKNVRLENERDLAMVRRLRESAIMVGGRRKETCSNLFKKEHTFDENKFFVREDAEIEVQRLAEHNYGKYRTPTAKCHRKRYSTDYLCDKTKSHSHTKDEEKKDKQKADENRHKNNLIAPFTDDMANNARALHEIFPHSRCMWDDKKDWRRRHAAKHLIPKLVVKLCASELGKDKKEEVAVMEELVKDNMNAFGQPVTELYVDIMGMMHSAPSDGQCLSGWRKEKVRSIKKRAEK